MVVYGHVLAYKPKIAIQYRNNLLLNIIRIIRLFFAKPIPNVRVQMQWNNQHFFPVLKKMVFKI